MYRIITMLFVAAGLCVVATGCAGGKLKAKGRITMKGQPLTLKEGETVNVVFVPILPDGKPPRDYYYAEFNPADATFWSAGKDKQGMPPGKYRVAVALKRDKKDVLKGEYDEYRSKFVFDFDSNSPEVTIDISEQPKKS
jgi:hypothetical protein